MFKVGGLYVDENINSMFVVEEVENTDTIVIRLLIDPDHIFACSTSFLKAEHYATVDPTLLRLMGVLK